MAYTDKWRVVSSRVFLPIQIRVLTIHPSSFQPIDPSIIHLDLFTSTKVGSKLLQLGTNNNQTKWFVLISSIEYTRYFHVNFQSGELILLRPIDELINQTSILELHINVTNNWIDMQTIRVNLFFSSFFAKILLSYLDPHSFEKCSIITSTFFSNRLL